MTFYPGDKVIYNVTKKEYFVKRCYYVVFNGEKIELIDVDIKPLISKGPDNDAKFFKGYNAKYFKLIKRNENN